MLNTVIGCHFGSGTVELRTQGWQVAYDSGKKFGIMFRNDNGDQFHGFYYPLDLNQWYHLAAVYDNDGTSTTTKLYLNGQLLDTKVHTNQIMNIVTTASNLFIATNQDGAPKGGSYSGTREINGTIDEVVIYYKALTDAQVLESYNNAGHLCS